MKSFIFRNNTIEPFFGDIDYNYSGYDDISLVPKDVDEYIWFYQVPFKNNTVQLAAEIETYFDKLMLAFSQIHSGKNLIVFSLENLNPTHLIDNEFSVSKAIESFNDNAIAFAEKNTNVKIIDFKDFISHYPKSDWVNWKFYFMSQMQLNPKLAKDFKKWFSYRENAIRLKRKKCLVLDLDNTLWGGILGEDGIDGIKLGGDYPGKAFHYWQESLLELSKIGVILCICSKNNEADVLEVWEKNPYMILKKDNISAYEINWDDKATNLQKLSKELSIGLDSMVFVDDNPTERDLIKQILPMVSVPDFPSHPYELPSFYLELVNNYFRVYSITKEDCNKTAQYKANVERAKEQAKFVCIEDYLRTLQIEINIIKADNYNIERIAQMTQKTNQFNLTSRRYTDADVRLFIDRGWDIYCINVKDKFGDNGITGSIFLEPIGDKTINIDTLLLSCRILGKGIEFAFIYSILNKLYSEGIKIIRASYIPTSKNSQVENFYEKAGLLLEKENGSIKKYSLKLNERYKVKDYYNIKFK